MDMDRLNFEDAMKRIDEIVAKLEDQTLKLDESLVLYEEFGESRICMSAISVSALVGRMENDIEN